MISTLFPLNLTVFPIESTASGVALKVTPFSSRYIKGQPLLETEVE